MGTNNTKVELVIKPVAKIKITRIIFIMFHWAPAEAPPSARATAKWGWGEVVLAVRCWWGEVVPVSWWRAEAVLVATDEASVTMGSTSEEMKHFTSSWGGTGVHFDNARYMQQWIVNNTDSQPKSDYRTIVVISIHGIKFKWIHFIFLNVDNILQGCWLFPAVNVYRVMQWRDDDYFLP